jgi:hypothetical protein
MVTGFGWKRRFGARTSTLTCVSKFLLMALDGPSRISRTLDSHASCALRSRLAESMIPSRVTEKQRRSPNSQIRLTGQRLIPLEAARNVSYPYDGPRPLHGVLSSSSRRASNYSQVRQMLLCQTFTLNIASIHPAFRKRKAGLCRRFLDPL